ncbi:MAG: aminotransferase class I/II-fold pyridoxal phosphate-dependent enzyme [Acidimicrobiia bacterium]|nr:aminotransferase class I/II-fold pyridoxal phosphate-dependent enzyme [Acidimicrobiia bacterium]
MEVMKAAARREVAGGDVLHLEVGQPMTPAPSRVREAARRGLAVDRLGYTAATGLVALRARVGRFYGERYGLDVSHERVVMTIGASAGFVLSCLALFDPGDRVAMTVPGYSAYRNVLTALGLELVEVRVDAETRFVPAVDRLEAAGPLDGLVVASPSNPTGVTLTAEEMKEVAGFCSTTGTVLISDEIYHGIDYGERAATALEFSESAVVVQSFSKYFSMTGWRLGWLVVPPEMFRPLERLAQNLFIAPPTVSQLGALEAFDCTDELDANVAAYARSREILVAGLAEAGITRIAPPDGGFYVYADVSHLGMVSPALCTRWLEEIGVAATPGIDFDPEQGDRWVRFSYSESTADIVEAVSRLKGWAHNTERRDSDKLQSTEGLRKE